MTAIGNTPLVSLIITSYNRANLIERAITSALAQDYPNLEIIISDNRSTDNSDEVIRRYTADPRVKYSVNDTNIGMIANFVKATSILAKGKYVTYVSSDDYLVNNRFISEAIDRIGQVPSVVLVHSVNLAELPASGEVFVDASYAVYKDSYYRRPSVNGREVFDDYPRCNSISFGGTLMDREKLLSVRSFEGNAYSADVQIALQLLLLGDAAFIDEPTYVARRHDGSMTYSLARAEPHIQNLAFIDVPCAFAEERGLLDQQYLLAWKERMYEHFCSQCLLTLYKTNRVEYRKFASFVRATYPSVYKRITRNASWYFNATVFANASVGRLYLGARRYARRLISLFRPSGLLSSRAS